MDGARSPRRIGPDQYAYGRNGSERGEYWVTRPGFRQSATSWQSEAVQNGFNYGRWQGANMYQSSSGQFYIVTSVSGEIYMFNVSGSYPIASKPDNAAVGTNRTDTDLAWIKQVGVHFVVQDGSSKPIIGTGTVIRRAQDTTVPDPDSDTGGTITTREIPTGEEMAFGIGRAVVARGREYFIGDYDLPNDPDRVLKFTNQEYFEDGGGFAAPINMGAIIATEFMPTSDTASGQGPLFVLGTNGAITTNLNVPRAQWATTQLQTITLTDIGGTGPYNLTSVNNDLWWRSPDGIRSYRQARSEEQGWSKTPASEEISPILNSDAGAYLQNCSSVFWDNYLLTTCNPVKDAKGIYWNGMAVLDFEPVSGISNKRNPAWCGLWDGIRILQVLRASIAGKERCFLFFRDKDGKNQLGEIVKGSTSDLYGCSEVAIEWEWWSRSFNFSKVNSYKKLMHADLFHENVVGRYEVNVSFRNEIMGCWTEWASYCLNWAKEDCSGACIPSSLQPGSSSVIRLPECPDTCTPNYQDVQSENGLFTTLQRKARMGYEHQLKISGRGYGKISRLILYGDIEKDDAIPACSASCTAQENPCCVEQAVFPSDSAVCPPVPPDPPVEGDYDIQWEILSDSSHNVVQTPEPYNLQNQTGDTYVATDLYNDPPTEDFYGLERLIIISRGNFTLSGQALLQLGGVSSFSGEYIARVFYVKNADAPVELGRIATSVWGSIEETVPVNLSLVNGDTLNLYFEIQSDAWQEGDAGNALIHFSDFTVMPT